MLYMVEDLNKRTEELNEERRKLEFSNKELEAFTYSVSHDLRAPLRAINGFSKFLLEDYASDLDDEGRRYIETIRNNAKKMDQLITDLLNLSRISRSKININKTDMAAVATSMFHEIATEEEKKAFEFILRVPDKPAQLFRSAVIHLAQSQVDSHSIVTSIIFHSLPEGAFPPEFVMNRFQSVQG